MYPVWPQTKSVREKEMKRQTLLELGGLRQHGDRQVHGAG